MYVELTDKALELCLCKVDWHDLLFKAHGIVYDKVGSIMSPGDERVQRLCVNGFDQFLEKGVKFQSQRDSNQEAHVATIVGRE